MYDKLNIRFVSGGADTHRDNYHIEEGVFL